MNESELIPEFKKKELNLEYLSIEYEDNEFQYFKFLYSAMRDFRLHLSLTQIIGLLDYREKALNYLKELYSILTETEVDMWKSKSVLMDFMRAYSPKSKAEELILKIYTNLCNEIVWIDETLKIEELDYLNGDD